MALYNYHPVSDATKRSRKKSSEREGKVVRTFHWAWLSLKWRSTPSKHVLKFRAPTIRKHPCLTIAMYWDLAYGWTSDRRSTQGCIALGSYPVDSVLGGHPDLRFGERWLSPLSGQGFKITLPKFSDLRRSSRSSTESIGERLSGRDELREYAHLRILYCEWGLWVISHVS